MPNNASFASRTELSIQHRLCCISDFADFWFGAFLTRRPLQLFELIEDVRVMRRHTTELQILDALRHRMQFHQRLGKCLHSEKRLTLDETSQTSKFDAPNGLTTKPYQSTRVL